MLRALLFSGLFVFVSMSNAQEDCEQKIQSLYSKALYTKCIEQILVCYPDSVYLEKVANYHIQSLYKTGLYRHAKDLGGRFLKDSLNVINTHTLLAQIYEAEENAPKSIKHYTALYRSDTTEVSHVKKLARLYSRSGDPSSAFFFYKKANKINPQDIAVIASISELMIDNDQLAVADSLLSYAIGLDSTNIKIQLLTARIQYMQKDYPAVVETMDKVYRDIDLSQYFNKLYGYSLLRVDSLDQAIFFLEKALVGERSNREYAHYYLATAYEKKDMPDYAKYHYNQALGEAISVNTSTYYKNLGILHESDGEFKEAIQYYKKGLEWNDGKDDILWFYLARAEDNYYKDKSIAIRHYAIYVESSDSNKELKTYAFERIKYLRGIVHMSK